MHSRVKYFDPIKRRAGVPADVASLVTKMTDEIVRVTIININKTEEREIIVQTGGYGEHQCIRVETEGKVFPVNERFFTVKLAPGSGSELVIYNRRYANSPTLAFP